MEPSESAKGIAIISLSVKGEEKQKFIEISPSDEGTSLSRPEQCGTEQREQASRSTALRNELAKSKLHIVQCG